jgi:hypothetical protein
MDTATIYTALTKYDTILHHAEYSSDDSKKGASRHITSPYGYCLILYMSQIVAIHDVPGIDGVNKGHLPGTCPFWESESSCE